MFCREDITVLKSKISFTRKDSFILIELVISRREAERVRTLGKKLMEFVFEEIGKL